MKITRMKNVLIFCVMLLLLICVQFNGSQVSAIPREDILSEFEVVDSGNCGDGKDQVIWELFSDGTLIISGEGKIKQYDYLAGENSPFYNNGDIKYIVVKSGIERISDGLFFGCKNVKSVRIEEGVKYIEPEILDCLNVVSVTLPSTLAMIQFNNYSLFDATSIFFTGSKEQWDKIKGIHEFKDSNVYYDTLFCDELAYQIVDDHAKLIGVDGALCQEELVLPEKLNGYPLTEIGAYAFNRCFNVKHLVVPDSITDLGKGAFYKFSSLESIDLPDSITYLPESAFCKCDNLKEVILPDSITEFKSHIISIYGIKYDSGSGSTFAGCKNLQKIKLPQNLTALPATTFKDCKSLKEVIIPDSVTEFRIAYSIYSVNINSLEVKYTYYGSEVFRNCESLEKVVLSKNLKYLAKNSFEKCVSLKNIYIPESVKEVEAEAFKDCTALESVVFAAGEPIRYRMLMSAPESSGEDNENLCINSSAFENCASLKYVSIDRAIKKIEEKAFLDCNKLEDVYYNGNEQDWKKIEIGAHNENLLGARIHYNSQPDFDHDVNKTVIKQATCEEKGIVKYVCTCGAEFTGETSALGHAYSSKYTVDKKATCSTAGSQSKHCTREGCNEKTSKKVIYSPKTFSLSKTNYTYDGKNKTPTVTIKDSKGNKLVKNTDYKLSVASSRKGIGKYTVKVTFIGKYEGTKNVYFTILPGKPASVKSAAQTTSSVKLTWSKVSGAAGYTVYRYSPSKKAYVKAGTTEGTSLTVKDLLTGTKYTFKVVAYGKTSGGKVYNSEGYTLLKTATKTKTPELTKVTASSTKGKAYVYHSNVSGETGYTVYYSTSKTSGFKKYANFKANTTRCDITKLTSGKTYYFKVRTYIKTDSGYVYSPWSAVKGIKVK